MQSSMIPPFSLRSTLRVEENGPSGEECCRADMEEGVRLAMNSVEEGPFILYITDDLNAVSMTVNGRIANLGSRGNRTRFVPCVLRRTGRPSRVHVCALRLYVCKGTCQHTDSGVRLDTYALLHKTSPPKTRKLIKRVHTLTTSTFIV